MPKLFIVESPSKIKTIRKYLGNDWLLSASVGHVRDLPEGEMGVSEPDHIPTYQISDNKKDVVSNIKSLAAKCESVWLATDDDREGEAIAWHLQQVIVDHTYKRVMFTEITKQAIQEAIGRPGHVNQSKFQAQQARRVLDRYAGYLTSPLLRKKTGLPLTAGRVQTPALILVVNREDEINAFKPTTHYGLEATTNHKAKEPWSMEWDTKSFLEDGQTYLLDIEIATAIKDNLKHLIVQKFTDKETKKNPPPPLVSSTLQQAGSIQLKVTPKQVMKAAQSLYEAGLISYHRTDNPNLSDEAFAGIQAYLRGVRAEDYTIESKREWSVPEGAQAAHEAIRPTSFTTEDPGTGNKIQDAVYRLIWRASVCSQMKPALYETRNIHLVSEGAIVGVDKPVHFKAQGRKLIFAGWTRLMSRDPSDDDSEKSKENETQELPVCEEGERVDVQSMELLTKSTKPPARFTEASLVKKLEAEGVGRPSTYADTVAYLFSRSYVVAKARKIMPTETGRLLVALAKESFCFADIGFTNVMEKKLDDLEQGRVDYESVIDEFYSTLMLETQAFEAGVEIDPELIELAKPKEMKAHPCPKCDGEITRRPGSNGFFWGCKNYPECKYTAQDKKGEPEEYKKCPVCGQGNLRRTKQKAGGFFWGCSEFRQGCKAYYEDKRGKPVFKK